MQDSFLPTDADIEPAKGAGLPFDPPNLADDEALVEEVKKFLQYKFDNYKNQRFELEEVWNAANWMVTCGQDESTRETERTRTDRNSDSLNTKTNTQRVGSTMFLREVRSLAAVLREIVASRKDPVKLRSRYNPAIYSSPEQADEMAESHNTLMRWSGEKDQFKRKFVGLAFDLMVYGNVPVYVKWLRRRAEVLDKFPVKSGNGIKVDEKGKPVVRLDRREVMVENRPDWDWLDNLNFFADQNIPEMQDQVAILVRSPENISHFIAGTREKQYVNFDKITSSMQYKGGDSENQDDRERNEGLDSPVDKSNSGIYLRFSCYAQLPIDEDKPKGKRWDESKNIPKKYVVTLCTSEDPGDGVCLEIRRNTDPDDEYPFEMIHYFPSPKDRLYHLSLAQCLRSNYTEMTTRKQQSLDRNTLENNRPMIVKQGAVFQRTSTGVTQNLTFKADAVWECENPAADVKEFSFNTIPSTSEALNYLEADSDEAAGNNRATRGEPMGQRTSSYEAQSAYTASSRTHLMLAEYALEQFLTWRTRKYLRYWHCFADEDQLLRITDDPEYVTLRPYTLFGDFDIEMVLVTEYEKTLMQRESWTYAAQNILPLMQPYLNGRYVAQKALDEVLGWDDPMLLKRDTTQEMAEKARAENIAMMTDGQSVTPSPAEDHAVMLVEHEGERLLWKYVKPEDDPRAANLPLLEQHIEMTKQMMAKQPQMLPGGTPAQASGNQTEGEMAGNMIAGERGAELGGPMAGAGGATAPEGGAA